MSDELDRPHPLYPKWTVRQWQQRQTELGAEALEMAQLENATATAEWEANAEFRASFTGRIERRMRADGASDGDVAAMGSGRWSGRTRTGASCGPGACERTTCDLDSRQIDDKHHRLVVPVAPVDWGGPALQARDDLGGPVARHYVNRRFPSTPRELGAALGNRNEFGELFPNWEPQAFRDFRDLRGSEP